MMVDILVNGSPPAAVIASREARALGHEADAIAGGEPPAPSVASSSQGRLDIEEGTPRARLIARRGGKWTISQVYEISETDGTLFIVMELLDATSGYPSCAA